jgi:hypothetical protein
MLRQRKSVPRVRVSRSGERFNVWLYQVGRPRELTGSVNARLADDALRHGQDLINELVEKSLREADRRRTIAVAGD